MSVRHKIIEWLAQGDMVILNAEVFPDGSFRRKNAGETYLSNVTVEKAQNTGVSIGSFREPSALSIIDRIGIVIGTIEVRDCYRGLFLAIRASATIDSFTAIVPDER